MPILILGKSGSGKSTSMRNFPETGLGIISVIGKPLPFRRATKPIVSTDYQYIKGILKNCKTPSVAIDDAGYLLTDMFMSRHASTGKGNDVFALYNDIGDSFYKLVQFIMNETPEERIVYLMMHEDKSDFGDIKPQTIGKLLNEKVNIEGMFTIVLRCIGNTEKHVFMTQSEGFDVAKSPMGMFETLEIPNDLLTVDTTIRAYYGLTEGKEDKKGKEKAE
jgi:hypothetical protein